ncbi:MAG: 50S ribosomal protein L22 [Candidatus Improbicoccus devescovinae]|nr:MAG: 50S ribosomal protein L22 [Candidatus Improbicoccus devescovinae]
MEASAYLKYVRISPRKVSIVLDLIRDKSVDYAFGVLKYTRKSACEYIVKLLASAVANAVNNKNMNSANLYIVECFAGPGPTVRRMLPVSKGRGHRILKRSSHISLTVGDEPRDKKVVNKKIIKKVSS